MKSKYLEMVCKEGRYKHNNVEEVLTNVNYNLVQKFEWDMCIFIMDAEYKNKPI